MHRDIKPANLLISMEGDLKIADFGVAKDIGGIGSNIMHTMYRGTEYYMAPEVLIDGYSPELYNKKCDVYSAGVVLY